jgi:ABC-type cobalt transport system substrate-binding protein
MMAKRTAERLLLAVFLTVPAVVAAVLLVTHGSFGVVESEYPLLSQGLLTVALIHGVVFVTLVSMWVREITGSDGGAKRDISGTNE